MTRFTIGMLTGPHPWVTRRAVLGVPPLSRLLGWTLVVGITCFAVRGLVHLDSWSYAMAWPAVAPQLVALLTSPRRQWPAYLAAFLAVQIIPARLVLGIAPEIGVVSTLAAVVFAAAMLHRDQDWVVGRTDTLRSWQRFLLCGVYLGPALATPIGVAGLVLNGEVGTEPGELLHAAMAWYLTEAVGIAFLVPLMLRWRHYVRPHSWRDTAWFASMIAVTVALFAASATMSSFVLVFLSGLPALLVLIRSGIAAAFAATAAGSAMALGGTFAGYGPFALSLEDPGQAMISAQVFVLGAFTMLVLVAAALEDRMRLAALEDVSHKAYELVADLTGDVVIVVDADGSVLHRASHGHEILDIPDGPIAKSAWLSQVHPDDRAALAGFPLAIQGASEPFRVRRIDGGWGWYVLHSRRTEDGLTAAIMRDVTLEREVQESLTDMVNTDPLTGLANRRGLDMRAGELWLRARAAGEQVTALFVDIDHFKSFNDLYGHQAGDVCLQHIGEVLAHLADPSVCVAARYGGEEFAVVCSGCDDPMGFAKGLVTAIRSLAIPHAGAPKGTVTVSVGVATLRPWVSDADLAVRDLLDRADKALYAAKSVGRDAVSVYREAGVLLGE